MLDVWEPIFVPGNVPSSKNSRQWTGKYSIASKTCQKYYKASEEFYTQYKDDFKLKLKGLEPPYKVVFCFCRGSKHKFDYINPAQTVQDQMVKYGWLDDDNADNLIPIFHPYTYDKDKAGVYINVLR